MERALKRLQWMTALIYLDDVIAFGEAFKNELLERPSEVFTMLPAAHLKQSPIKCCPCLNGVQY